MTLQEAKKTIDDQILLGRTDKAWPITKEALAYLEAASEDDANIEAIAIKCLNCGLIFSILHSEDGCVNCGGLDLNDKI